MSDIVRDLRHLDKSLPAPTLRTSEVLENWLSDITECHRAAADEIDRLRTSLKSLAEWAMDDCGAEPGLTPGLSEAIALLGLNREPDGTRPGPQAKEGDG